jgi:endothelin-converting enzyme/putative endopeptidase
MKTKKQNKKNDNNKTRKSQCTIFQSNLTPFEKELEKTTDIEKYNLEKKTLKDLKKAISPSNIKPQDDFYSYINERWLKSFKPEVNQNYIVQFDDFRLIQDKVYRDLLQIINKYVTTNKNSKSPFYISFHNFYKSTTKKYNKKEFFIKHTKKLENIIDTLITNNNLWELLAYINRNEVVNWGSPLIWTLNPDDKEPSIFRSYIGGPTLSLIDMNVYFDQTNLENRKYKAKFLKNINEIFEFFYGKNHSLNPEDIFNVETKIAKSFSCNVLNKKNDLTTYHKITPKEALERFHFNWDEYSKALGFKKTPDFFITTDVNYLLCIVQLLLKEWNTSEWRTYWIYIYMRMIIRFHKDGYGIYFKFHGNYEKGMLNKTPFDIYKIFSLGYAFNTFLSKEYIQAYKNEAIIEYVKTMAEDLKKVFIRIIKRNTWLQSKTKEKALQKLYKLKLQIGSPNILLPDPILNYMDYDILENLKLISEWRHYKAISLEGKHVENFPVLDWSQLPPKFISTQSYVVNASYTPSSNSIYIPLAYLQKPFIDLDERGIEYNLAHLGFTLSHEMSHALDDWGSQYDENGKLKNWWTPSDQKIFKKIQEDIVKQYETFASYDGIKFDAWPSIGEDLADISGLTICREYLRDFQIKNKDILPIKDLSFKMFFTFFAFQQKQKISKRAISAQLKTNPHPLDKYRCNVPLSRLSMFRTIYNVEKGDKMWWHSTNKIWIN